MMKMLLIFGKSLGKRGDLVIIQVTFYSIPAMIQKSLQEHHLQEQKHLTGCSGSSEQCVALTED